MFRPGVMLSIQNQLISEGQLHRNTLRYQQAATVLASP